MMANTPAISNIAANQSVDDVMLMAYADDQLTADQRALVERQLVADPSLQIALDAFKQSSSQARAHWRNPAPAVPEALQSKIEAMVAKAQANQASAAQVRPSLPQAEPAPTQLQQRPAANSSWYAMVATVSCMAVGTLAYLAGAQQAGSSQQTSQQGGGAALVLTADARQLNQWQQHMSGSPSGVLLPLAGGAQAAPAQLKILATVRDAQGRLCREFSLGNNERNTLGVACHQPDSPQSWQLQFAAHMPLQANGYTPASSTQVMDAFITSIGAGAALGADEETKALASLGTKSPQ
jgi:hypothetical protein